MVLFAIVGELGSGKTLSLTYLAWHNWFNKGRRIYSNYNLYGFPFTKIGSVDDLDNIYDGFFSADELWLYVDAWAGRTKKKKIIANILLKSRKRGLTIAYTSQSFKQVAKRIRDVTDFISYPIMGLDNSYCRVEVFRTPASRSSRINPPLYYNVRPVIAMFNSYEEIKMIKDENPAPMREMFLPIKDNPAWIRFLKEEEGITDRERIIKESEDIQNKINPQGITSEADRTGAEGRVQLQVEEVG